MGHLYIQYGSSFEIVWDVSHYSMWHLSLPLRGTVPVIDVRPVLTWFRNLTVCSFCIQWYILCFSTVNVYFDSMGISHYSMGHLSNKYTVWDIYIYTVWDIYLCSMGHLSIPNSTSLITIWDIYLQYGTYIYTVWNIYLYTMGHISIHYGTSPHIVCDIYLYINGHLFIQYGTSNYAVWDISHYNMGYIYTVWDI